MAQVMSRQSDPAIVQKMLSSGARVSQDETARSEHRVSGISTSSEAQAEAALAGAGVFTEEMGRIEDVLGKYGELFGRDPDAVNVRGITEKKKKKSKKLPDFYRSVSDTRSPLLGHRPPISA